MVDAITLSLSLLLHVHQIGGGYLRFNDPEHMTAPLGLEDLDPGSYDELRKYNPSLAPFEVVRYGGDPNKPFDWSAPEIEGQEIALITEANDFMYTDETEGMAEENRDEINVFSRVNRAEAAKIPKEIRDETDIAIEKKKADMDIATEKRRVETVAISTEKNKHETVKTIADKNRNETDIIAEKISEKSKAKPSSLKYFTIWPIWFDDKTSVYVTANQTETQKNIGWTNKNWIINETSTERTASRFQARFQDLNITRPRRFDMFNKKFLRKQIRPKNRSYLIEVPQNERTLHDRHIPDWDQKNTHDYNLTGTYIASCYRCGELNYGKWWRPSVEARERNGKVIPTGILCYEAFQGDDWRLRTKAYHLRTRCYHNGQQTWKYEIGYDNYNYYHECVPAPIHPFVVNRTYDLGNPMECFARYTGKCFKRYLDVGKVYTERGCASWPPHQSNSFASHRFTKMEFLLYKKDNGCVSSPIASMTPFDRGVSLYVRYHVCVCTGRWCNAATHCTVPLLLLFFTLSFLSVAYGT